MTDLIFFLVFVLSVLGQFADTRTTEVALSKGFVEANSLAGKVINKFGIQVFYWFKCGILPGLSCLALGLGHRQAALLVGTFVAVLGLTLGLLNYLKMKKAGITFNQIF